MIKLLEIIKINKPVPNNLKQLEQIQSQIKSSNNLKKKRELALKVAELVLPIWNYYYPNDKRPQKAVESAKLYLADPTEENKVKLIDAYAAAYAAYHVANAAGDAAASAASAAAADAAYKTAYAAYAAYAAIRATKIHFKINEIIKINKPISNNLKQLEQIQSQIKSSNNLKKKRELALKVAELVLPIWNHYYPNDKRPQVAIEASKLYLANPTTENKVKLKDAYDAAYAAYDAAADAAAYAAYAVVGAYAAAYAVAGANAAIKATKIHFKIK